MNCLIIFLVSLNLVQITRAAPSRNLTALRTEYAPSFVPDPDGRGTWSLLYSSLFTLALCVWTAIHPNVPAPGTSNLEKYRYKFLWVVMAIFAPEIGVFIAFKQYRAAKRLGRELTRMSGMQLAQQAKAGSQTTGPSDESEHDRHVHMNNEMEGVSIGSLLTPSVG